MLFKMTDFIPFGLNCVADPSPAVICVVAKQQLLLLLIGTKHGFGGMLLHAAMSGQRFGNVRHGKCHSGCCQGCDSICDRWETFEHEAHACTNTSTCEL